MSEEYISLNNRSGLEFWDDNRIPFDDDRRRRLNVPISEEEFNDFCDKDLSVISTTKGFYLVARIPAGVELEFPSGPADLVFYLKRWVVKQRTGVVAYLQSATPTPTTPKEA